MTLKDLSHYRLYNQRISKTSFKTPEEVIMWQGAIQAQDYLAGLWAIGLRMQHPTEIDVEQALCNKTIVRTWPLRGTLHFVCATDVHWMIELTAPRLLSYHAQRLLKDYELDEKVIVRCKKVLTSVLQKKKQLTRDAVYNTLEKANIAVKNQRGLQILWRLAQDKLICFGARQGKQQTFVLLDDWIPKSKSYTRDESLAELATRYFTSHGPATLQDFTWWSGLAPRDAKAGLEMIKSKLIHEQVAEQVYWMSSKTKMLLGPSVHLLPSFDEYLIAYSDRVASLDVTKFQNVVTKNGIFNPIVVMNGKVTGTWKRILNKNSVEIDITPFTAFAKTQKKIIDDAAKRYGFFLNKELSVVRSKKN